MVRLSLLLFVLTASQAVADQAGLRDIRSHVPVETLPPFVFTVSALLLVGGLLLARRHARRRTFPEVSSSPTGRPEDDSLARLAEEYRLGHCPGDLLIYRLDGVVRGAVLVRTGIPARQLTSAELLKRAGTDLTGDGRARSSLQLFLSLSDRVKFAGHRPDAAEVEEALRVAASLLVALPEGPLA